MAKKKSKLPIPRPMTERSTSKVNLKTYRGATMPQGISKGLEEDLGGMPSERYNPGVKPTGGKITDDLMLALGMQTGTTQSTLKSPKLAAAAADAERAAMAAEGPAMSWGQAAKAMAKSGTKKAVSGGSKLLKFGGGIAAAFLLLDAIDALYGATIGQSKKERAALEEHEAAQNAFGKLFQGELEDRADIAEDRKTGEIEAFSHGLRGSIDAAGEGDVARMAASNANLLRSIAVADRPNPLDYLMMGS